MKSPLLVLDVHYLCHRAFYAQRDLTWEGVGTGAIFGFLKSIGMLKAEFQTDAICFCFESKHLFRKQLCPQYKARRGRLKTQEERNVRMEFTKQIFRLRTRYLPIMGFRNIFQQEGMESDDIMAAIAQDTTDQEVVLVTADSDLFQCLREGVIIYNPQKKFVHTHKWFQKTYGIKPRQWVMVKVLAGCKTDNVCGIPGVGEKTAIKYILSSTASVRPSLAAALFLHRGRIVDNRKLVLLPYEGCKTPRLRKDQISRSGWDSVCRELGMHSLLDRPPVWSQTNLYA